MEITTAPLATPTATWDPTRPIGIAPGRVACANTWPAPAAPAQHPAAGHTLNCWAGFTPCRCAD